MVGLCLLGDSGGLPESDTCLRAVPLLATQPALPLLLRSLWFLSLWVALALGPLLAPPGGQFCLGQCPWTLPGTKKALCKDVSNEERKALQALGVGWAILCVYVTGKVGVASPVWGGEERVETDSTSLQK